MFQNEQDNGEGDVRMSSNRFRNTSATVQQPLVSTSNTILQQIGKSVRLPLTIQCRNVAYAFFVSR